MNVRFLWRLERRTLVSRFVLPVTQPPPGARRVLLVDDEPIVRDSVRRLLAFDGYVVEPVASGPEALAALQNSSFDLVITDYEMPGMKGDQLAAAIKAILPQQPVLMISAYGEQLRSPMNPLSAVDIIVTKPFQIDELRQAISILIVKLISVPGTQPGQDRPPAHLRS